MSAPPLRAQILARSAVANVPVNAEQADQLVGYYAFLERWNQKINLTALPLAERADATIDRLLIEPLIASTQVASSQISWVDFGTGGGSPAIPLKIMRPAAVLVMIEARARKAAFLREAVSSLGLPSASVKTARIEELSASELVASVDLITVRAVRMDREVLEIARNLLKMQGALLIFRGQTDQTDSHGFTLLREQSLSPSSGFLSTFQPTI